MLNKWNFLLYNLRPIVLELAKGNENLRKRPAGSSEMGGAMFQVPGSGLEHHSSRNTIFPWSDSQGLTNSWEIINCEGCLLPPIPIPFIVPTHSRCSIDITWINETYVEKNRKKMYGLNNRRHFYPIPPN